MGMEMAEAEMTPAQIAEAQKLAREWMEEHRKEIDQLSKQVGKDSCTIKS